VSTPPRTVDYDGLREYLETRAATEQELGANYSETPGETALEQAHFHWGRAEALRDLLEYLDREAGRMCRGGSGCRLGTDDADRRECGCDEGCCEARQ
jgi:hypothetical protein